MFPRPIINASTILKHNSIMHEIYIEQYAQDIDFKDVYEALSNEKKVEELDYYVKYLLSLRLSQNFLKGIRPR